MVNPVETSTESSGGSSGVVIAGFAGGFNRARFRGGGASGRRVVVGGVDAEEGGVGNISGVVISCWLCRKDDRLCCHENHQHSKFCGEGKEFNYHFWNLLFWE